VAFSASRPDDSFESPADLQAIREAEHNMGDFKLKSDPEYVPPEVQTVFFATRHAWQLLSQYLCHQAVLITPKQDTCCVEQQVMASFVH